MPRNYVYTDLATKDSLYLDVEGVDEFEVTQFSSSWAANEIPTAAVMLAVGRNARTQKHATAHFSGRLLKQMQRATVWFEPKGEYDRGIDWPAGRRKIFEGFFTGFAYRKISGKIHIVGNLIHWLAALGFGSAVTRNGHVSNPTQLNSAAVLQALPDTAAGEAPYIALHVPMQICADDIQQDMWRGIKNVFCSLSNIPTLSPTGSDGQCGGTGNPRANDAAQYALGKIEGPAAECDVDYKWGVPLVLDTLGISVAEESIAASIGNEMIESYSGVSFWDKLVGQLCPMFGMAVIPMVNSAVVAADCPAYSGGNWRTIQADDYDSYDMTRELHRPLRAVGVIGGFASQTQPGVNGNKEGEFISIGGCYAEDSVEEGDGMIMYVPAPPWLQMINTASAYAGGTQGVDAEKASPSATTPGMEARSDTEASSDGTVGTKVNELYKRYAHQVYVNQMLRGQSGGFSGKLRFDIAPLSVVKIRATSEKFIGLGQDDLAETIVGCVQRVTIAINAEAGMAGTSFMLSHVRTEGENKLPRTSTPEHPLFGKSIHGGGRHGCPLVDDYEFPDPVAVAPPPRPSGSQ